ncbi:hypothetical protein ACXYX3_06625 [Mycobacterium sp. C3-094]
MSDNILFAATPNQWQVTTRQNGGVARDIVSGTFNPPLKLNRDYRFEMDVADNAVTVRVPDGQRSGRVGTIGLVGNRAFWELFADPEAGHSGLLFSADVVWAAEQGATLAIVPD